MVTFAGSMNRVFLAIAVASTAPAVQAAESTAPGTGALGPTQITAIRAVGRTVLAAKKSGDVADPADADLLERLRSTVDRLLAADLDAGQRSRITVRTAEGVPQRSDQEYAAAPRESMRAEARALASQLRSRGELMAARVRSAPERDAHSGGLPIGEQRARFFIRWSQKLDAALADDTPNRVGQLLALREQLRPTSRLDHAPLSRGTPTLQAMPAGYTPPKNEIPAKE